MRSAVQSAIQAFKSAGVVGVIVDLRGNGGGEDSSVPDVLSHFTASKFVYEVVALPRQTMIDLG